MVDHGSQWQKVPKVSGFVGEDSGRVDSEEKETAGLHSKSGDHSLMWLCLIEWFWVDDNFWNRLPLY